jgi:photosystem II stability/assembly factor-like uncharacterized protein
MTRRSRLLISGLAAGLAAVALLAVHVSRDGHESAADRERLGRQSDGRGPAAPTDFFLNQRMSGKIPDASDFQRATRQAHALSLASLDEGPQQSRRAWELVGPTNIGGRIADVVIDPLNGDVVYAAAASGGVWKSTDAGATFLQVWPADFSQTMGALAITPDGTVWAGTGESNGGAFSYGGTGLYRSSDGGATWVRKGPENIQITGRIVIDPVNPDRMFVAATGFLWTPGDDRGIYRSEDGGETFELVLAPETPTAGAADITIDPANPNRIFATMWDRRGEFDRRLYGGVGSGLYRSTDGGDTWERLENIVTPASTDAIRLARHPDLGRISVVFAPSNPARLYVYAINRVGGNGLGFYYSDDGGNTLHARVDPGSQGGFGWWFGRIWVDPRNENHVFVAGVNLRRSTNGGTSWGNSTGVHADQHAMAWDLTRSSRVYLGNDGGIYRSETNGAGSWVKAIFEPYTQMYTVEVGETAPERVTGGTQDNGCLRSWTPTSQVWNMFGCGDGLATLVDPVDPTIYYGCSQNGSCIRRQDGNNSFSATISNGTVSQRRNWLTPLVFDPNNSQILYYGGNVLNRSTNRGSSWTALSPSSPNDLAGTTDTPDRDPNFGTITTIAPARTAPSTIYLGTDTGRVWKTDNLGATWTELVDSGLPRRWVTRVAVDPRNADVAYATFSGFRWAEDAAHVFATEDGGETWHNISGILPNAPVNDVVVDAVHDLIYVATDVGVYYLNNKTRPRGRPLPPQPVDNWREVGAGLPLAPTHDIRLHEPSRTLFAATHGRAIWKIDVEDLNLDPRGPATR